MAYYKTKNKIKYLKALWIFNLILVLYYFSSIYWVYFIKSSILEYSNIKSDSFDWTIYPITYIPDWTKVNNVSKNISFDDEKFDINNFIELPNYDLKLMEDSSWKNKDSILVRYTYPVVYMWSYRLNYIEYDWSHPAVDIRAPIWTPVLSIANWVIIITKNVDTWNWKYVVIRHDNINWETFYSSYLHLSEINVQEWTKIKRWELIWKVWMTWITTTPHLHFQIDKKDSLFYPYWPFTFKEASDLWLDFFGAINVWLWKEKAIAYTINPMNFIDSHLNKNLTLIKDDIQINNNAQDISLIKEDNKLLASTEENVNLIFTNTWTDIINSDINNSSNNANLNLQENNNSVWIKNNLSNINIDNKNNVWIEEKINITDQIFKDIDLNSKFYKPTAYLYNEGIVKWYNDNTFKPNNNVSRWEALIFILKLYNIPLDSKTNINFSDIKQNNYLVPFLKKALDLWLISKNKIFRPNDPISRAEFITILIKTSKKPLSNYKNSYFNDIKEADWYYAYINTFTEIYIWNISWNKAFEPNNTFNRWQIAQILYTFYLNK